MERPKYITKTLAASSLLALLLTSVLPSADAHQRKRATPKPAVKAEEKSTILFEPELGSGSLVIYDPSGKPIGSIDEETSTLEVTIANKVVKQATQPDGMRSSTLLDGLTNTKLADGRTLVMMRLPQQITTSEGKLLPAGYPVWLDRGELLKPGALQPVGAKANAVVGENSTQEEIARVAKANEVAEAVVTAVQNGGTKDVPQQFEHEEHPSEEYDAEDSIEELNEQLQENHGGRFLSTPTCNCVRGTCRVTSPFGYRKAPKTRMGRGSSYHGGLDIGGGMGTPIIAAADGVVVAKRAKRKPQSPSGIEIELDHQNGFTTAYKHLKGFAPNVKLGDRIKKGQIIGYMGATGRCSGPHLHFSVKKKGVNVNPKQYMLASDSSDLSGRCPDQQALLNRRSTGNQSVLVNDQYNSQSPAPTGRTN